MECIKLLLRMETSIMKLSRKKATYTPSHEWPPYTGCPKYFGVFARLVKFHQLVLQLVAARLVNLYEKDPIELGTKYDG